MSLTGIKIETLTFSFVAIVGAQVIGREGPVVDNFIPIFLSDLNCKSSDTMILSCRATARGITECNHTMDVYVSCEGGLFLYLHVSKCTYR